VYEVEDLVECRKLPDACEYLVKWLGYDESTWEVRKY
jgi:hypothetical protein